MSKKIRVAVLGASGYSGWELVRLLERHGGLELVATGAHSEAGKTLQDLNPRATPHLLLDPQELLSRDFEACFVALPHGAAQSVVGTLVDQGRVAIDLSADFRLQDAELYANTYGAQHTRPELLSQAVYGLTEWNRERLSGARLVANPGCYPTCVLLALAPWARRGWLDTGRTLVADCKSGVSGAGRSAKIASLFVEVNENLSPYQLGNVHRHTVEMEQELSRFGAPASELVFSPHLVPLSQGMLATLYVPWPEGLEQEEIRRAYLEDYGGEPFVGLLPSGQTASVSHTRATNRCALSLHPLRQRNTMIVVSSIDNLIKGAAGQALQNFNRIFGFAESEGLL